MIGQFPRAVLIACLTMLRWLLFVVAALMLILLVVQHIRGEAAAAPLSLGLGAVGMAAGGWLCGVASAWFERAE